VLAVDYDTFLSLGVQLIPVLWVVIVLETTWLGAKAQSSGTHLRLAVRAWVVNCSIPAGGIALILALVALLLDVEPLKVVAGGVMFLSLLVSTIVAVVSLMRALYDQAASPRPLD
jgi:hypothetical protein